MIDWLKYFPLHLRDAEEGAAIKGPAFSSARPVTLMPGGNIIRLRAPRHRTDVQERQVCYKGYDDLDNRFDVCRGATDNWKHRTLLFRMWTYWREWFGGGAGNLTMTVAVVTRAQGQEFHRSLFYPRVFESAVANYLNTVHGVVRRGHEKFQFSARAPINWKIHHHLPVFSCSFEERHSDYLEVLYFVFPITDRHFLRISFRFSGVATGMRDDMQALAHQIIDSVELALSSSSQEELARVKSDIGELSLSENFPPLKWPINVDEIENPPMPESMLSQYEGRL